MPAVFVKYKQVHCHTDANFPGCCVTLILKSTVSAKISPTKDSRCGLGAAVRSSSRVIGTESGPYHRQPKRSGYMRYY